MAPRLLSRPIAAPTANRATDAEAIAELNAAIPEPKTLGSTMTTALSVNQSRIDMAAEGAAIPASVVVAVDCLLVIV
jgi:hypothetical protein